MADLGRGEDDEVQKLYEELDSSTDAIMSTVGQILECQAQIDSCMKEGFLCMAKARYSLGVNRVSALQYNEESLKEASSQVQVTRDNGTPLFALVRGVQKEASGNEAETDTGIRHRRKPTGKDLDKKMEDLSLNQADAETNEKQSNHSSNTKVDPLKWFGVLVPQALRQSQQKFQQATEKSCQLATLKANLMNLREKHSKLMLRKHQLGPRQDEPKVELSDTESVDSDHSI